MIYRKVRFEIQGAHSLLRGDGRLRRCHGGCEKDGNTGEGNELHIAVRSEEVVLWNWN